MKNYNLIECIRKLQKDYLEINRLGLKEISGCENIPPCWRPDLEMLVDHSFEACDTNISHLCAFDLKTKLTKKQVNK